MHDERFDKLAKLLVEYSIRLKRNETVLIEAFDIPDEMTAAHRDVCVHFLHARQLMACHDV